ncbi:hypothetical protein [Paraburkholderia sediminicola]|uniref:hypothetical protein n=1 Tax=Paraburkholderia sediminicola TaxID=458836 RepID=UPI0038B9BAD9
MPLLQHLIEQLSLDQVDLSQVRTLAKPLNVIDVLIDSARVRVALNAEVFYQPDCRLGRFAESVIVAALYRDNDGKLRCVHFEILSMVKACG